MNFIIFLCIATLCMFPLYARIARIEPSLIPTENKPKPLILPAIPDNQLKENIVPANSTTKNEIIQKLENLLQQKNVDDTWYTTSNDLVIDLALIDRNLSNMYFKKILDKITQVSASQQKPKTSSKENIQTEPITPLITPSEIIQSKNDIVQQLNNALQQENIDDEWYAKVDDLVFDLALLDRNLSNEYLKKVHMKKPVEKKIIVTPMEKPSSIIPEEKKNVSDEHGIKKEIPAATPGAAMQKGTPPPPPPGKAMPKGTPPIAPTGVGMAKGTPPPPPGKAMPKGTPPPPPAGAGMVKKGPPPPPGPMVKGKKPVVAPTKGSVAPAASKGPEPLSVKESYSVRQLEKRSNEEITQLFNDLLHALNQPKFWDPIKKKPTLDWENRIGTTKKALLDAKRNIKIDVDKVITERIAQVKAEKEKEGLAKQAATEKKEEAKEKEEFSEKELTDKIIALNKNADVTNFAWLIEFQGIVKKLDKINHEKALGYETDFLKKFPDQKSFLPKPKPIQNIEIKKELTPIEKQIGFIDKILDEKPILWAIKIREPLQELYSMDSQLGLEYQDKYLAEVKKVTGKDEKPFLPLKK